jgi:DNA-binding NtrC family response regulator
MRETVVFFGNFAVEQRLLDQAAVPFGWSIKIAKSISRLRDLGAKSDVVAVLSDLALLAEPWNEALKAVRCAAPKALPIVCQRFSDTILWPELAEAGAFHSVTLPLNPCEVRQSFGFVWAARNQRRSTESTSDIYALERSLTVLSQSLVV